MYISIRQKLLSFFNIQSLGQWLIILFIIIASVLYWKQIDELHQESKKLQSDRGEYILVNSQSNIKNLINDVRRDVVLLAQGHRKQIKELISDPDNQDVYDALLGDIKDIYPEVFTVTIADQFGKPILQDYDGFVQQMCIDDIFDYSLTERYTDIYIHPNPFLYHFDIMSKLRFEAKEYIFFISFDSSLISKALKNSLLPGYQLLLVNRQIENLIEVTSDGSRNLLDGNNHLSEKQLSNLIDEADIPQTRWRLLLLKSDLDDRQDVGLFDDKHYWPIALLNLICIIALVMFQLMKRRIRGQEKLLEEKTNALGFSHEHLMALFTSVMDGMVTIDKHNIITAFNPAAENMFGYLSNEVTGENIKILLPESFHEEFDSIMESYLDNNNIKTIENTRNISGLKKNGELFPAEITISVVKHGDTIEFVWLIRDISYRTQVEKMKAEFISTVSHEMRTPLTSIRGSLGLIDGEAMGDVNPKIKEMISIALNNTQRMIKMINEILDIDRIESGNMLFHFDRVSLEAVAIASINNIKGFADENSITIDFRCLCEDTKILGDDGRLIQVLNNLLSNAIKFSHEDTSILVLLDCDDDYLTLSIKDVGIGISEDDQEYIFDKFSQVDSSNTRDIGGSGLGLSIVRSIIQAHQGRITLESKLGKGATFTVELPKK